MANQETSHFWGGLLLGTTIGSVVGLLVAPRTGKETRALVKKSVEALPELAEDVSFSVQMQANRLSGSAMKQWDDTLDRLRDAVQAGLEAAETQHQQLTRRGGQKTG